MSRSARASGEIARGHVNEQMRSSQGTLVWTDKPWVNLKPVPAVSNGMQKDHFPDCQITLGQDGLTLPEIGERITALCGIRVLFRRMRWPSDNQGHDARPEWTTPCSR